MDKNKKHKRTDFGKIPMCSVCGHNLLHWGFKDTCCKGGKKMLFQTYIEDIKHSTFNNEDWSWENFNDPR